MRKTVVLWRSKITRENSRFLGSVKPPGGGFDNYPADDLIHSPHNFSHELKLLSRKKKLIVRIW